MFARKHGRIQSMIGVIHKQKASLINAADTQFNTLWVILTLCNETEAKDDYCNL